MLELLSALMALQH